RLYLQQNLWHEPWRPPQQVDLRKDLRNRNANALARAASSFSFETCICTPPKCDGVSRHTLCSPMRTEHASFLLGPAETRRDRPGVFSRTAEARRGQAEMCGGSYGDFWLGLEGASCGASPSCR